MPRPLIDIDGCVHHQTELAVLFSTDGEEDNAKWVPKSQCEVEIHDEDTGRATITLSEKTATEKGLT